MKPNALKIITVFFAYPLMISLMLHTAFVVPEPIKMKKESTVVQLKENPKESSVKATHGTIVIDAGHGGSDLGVFKDGLVEKDINLVIAKKLKLKLEQMNYNVLMTRIDDKPIYKSTNISVKAERNDLDGRINYAKDNNAKLFVSIHVDNRVDDPNREGSVVYYYPKFEASKSYAIGVQRALNNLRVNDKPRAKNYIETENFYVIKQAEIPSILIEVGYITNSEDFELLMQEGFRDKIAEGISIGIGSVEVQN